MRLHLLIGAMVLLAGCFQAQAPPPAAARETTARGPDGPLQQVARLAEEPDEQTMSTLAAIARENADPEVRQEAVYVMADVGDEADAATVAEALRDPDEGVRIAAVDALSLMGGKTSAALLAGALNDGSVQVRQRAVDAFGDIEGPTGSLALQQALADPDASVREAAAELLEERNGARQ